MSMIVQLSEKCQEVFATWKVPLRAPEGLIGNLIISLRGTRPYVTCTLLSLATYITALAR